MEEVLSLTQWKNQYADRLTGTPFTLDKNNPRHYIGSEKLYKSTTRAEHWDSQRPHQWQSRTRSTIRNNNDHRCRTHRYKLYTRRNRRWQCSNYKKQRRGMDKHLFHSSR